MIEEITSLKNRLIRMAMSLKQKKYRDELGMFVAEGVRLVEDAIRSDWEIVCAFCTDKCLSQERALQIIDTLLEKQIRVYKVKKEIYEKLSDTEAPQGLMVLLRKRLVGEADLLARGAASFIVLLDGVQDPGNVGTVIRTAEAAGCSGVILLKGTADVYAGKVVRATMGSLFRIPVISQADEKAVLDFAAAHGIAILATALDDTARAVYETDLTRPVMLVFGNEGSGVSAQLQEAASGRLFIPMQGEAESLNVSAAAAVVLYEALRQRQYGRLR